MESKSIHAHCPSTQQIHKKSKGAKANRRMAKTPCSKPLNRPPLRCQICDRKPGTKKLDRFGNPDPNPLTPLGPLQRCRSCGLWVCPDCWHEVDCCFRDEAEHEDDPNWAPPGWKRDKDEWIRQ